MGHSDKRQRRQRRHEKKRRDQRRQPAAGEEELKRLAEQRGLKLLSYDVIFEPMDHLEEANRSADHLLGEAEKEELFRQVHDEPHAAIARLEELLSSHPGVPFLHNWLAAAYGRAGDADASDRVSKLNFERNPDYLFARLNYAQVLLHRGDLAGFERVMDDKFDLKLMYPHRDVFHVSEFTSFSALVIQYFLRKGNFRAAEILLESMERIAPDAEQTAMARGAVRASALRRLASDLAGRALRRGSLPF